MLVFDMLFLLRIYIVILQCKCCINSIVCHFFVGDWWLNYTKLGIKGVFHTHISVFHTSTQGFFLQMKESFYFCCRKRKY